MVRISFINQAVIILLLSFSSITVNAQTYQFKHYDENDGLPDDIIYTINQDHNGFVWLGTGKGLCRFDGFEYHMSYVSDTLDTSFPVSSYETDDGVIYFGFNDGSVYYTHEGSLVRVPGIDAVRTNDIVESVDSLIYVITQSKGIYVFNPENHSESRAIENPTGEFLYSASFMGREELILGTQNGLILCDYTEGELIVSDIAEELEFYKVQDIRPALNEGSFYVATEDNGLFLAGMEHDSLSIKRVSDADIFNESRIQSLMIDSSGVMWISTFGNGLIKAELDRTKGEISSYEVFDSGKGLTGNDIKTSYEDLWGNIWIGHFGDGVSVLSSEAYKFHRPGTGKRDNDIIYVGEYGGHAFAGTSAGFYLFDLEQEEIVSYTGLSRSVDEAVISTYLINEDGSMLIGTEGRGVYYRSSSGRTEQYFLSANNIENYIADILDEAGYYWLGTRSGVIVIDKKTGDSRRYTTSERLPHNNINQLVADGSGKALIATESNRLYYLDPQEGVISGKAVIRGGIRNSFQSFDKDKWNKIWGATETSGIYCFERDSVWNINSRSGLLSDNCYSLLCDSKDNIWVGHLGGFSFYNQGQDILRSFTDVFLPGALCNDNAIYETADGHILIGTTEGFLVYNPAEDKSKLYPPRTNIISVTINEQVMPLKEEYNLPYSPRYTVEVDYVGLNYSDPEKVYYSYSMENYDTEWSDPTYDRSVTYRLSDGNYRFNILAYTYDGLTDGDIQSFVINIKKPFWRTWWFLSGSAILLVMAVILIIRIRERAQEKAKKYLENELDKRTKEVRSQKEEIEYQNREITDSINYAQRIQASLLPPVKRLSERFKGSFVFYRPRDIVSGDFYWFDVVSDEKIIIVCADSTGHGVPGAFMSMIGSALLQEIINRKEITRPSEVLKTLDKEIATTLNQTGDDTSNDGMDMVVCEYNPKTRLLRFASALRPVIIVMDGEQYYIRGNKNSVGGEFMDEKYFDDQEYYLKENDMVYIFSDGYPDQFGGPDGKKLKIVRLRRLIDEMKDMEMDDQYTRVSEYFDEWKGDQDQVDDVLMMAFKV